MCRVFPDVNVQKTYTHRTARANPLSLHTFHPQLYFNSGNLFSEMATSFAANPYERDPFRYLRRVSYQSAVVGLNRHPRKTNQNDFMNCSTALSFKSFLSFFLQIKSVFSFYNHFFSFCKHITFPPVVLQTPSSP